MWFLYILQNWLNYINAKNFTHNLNIIEVQCFTKFLNNLIGISTYAFVLLKLSVSISITSVSIS